MRYYEVGIDQYGNVNMHPGVRGFGVIYDAETDKYAFVKETDETTFTPSRWYKTLDHARIQRMIYFRKWRKKNHKKKYSKEKRSNQFSDYEVYEFLKKNKRMNVLTFLLVLVRILLKIWDVSWLMSWKVKLNILFL